MDELPTVEIDPEEIDRRLRQLARLFQLGIALRETRSLERPASVAERLPAPDREELRPETD